jgi:NAD(P)-dependent dehydrogenase (short-subunit alcohol dehydrogenase family)
VLLVGASSAIGQAIAERFARDGDAVVGASIHPLEQTALRRHLVVDCATEAGATEAVSAVVADHGRLDVVVLAAAVTATTSITETEPDQWAATLDSVLTCAYQVCRQAIPEMGAGSAIVAVSSVQARVTVPERPAYSAAKAGLEGLVRQLALEYGPRGIRVNAVAPGAIVPGGYRAELAEGYPLGRPGRPSEVADAVHYLAGAEASFITGATLPVDGGLMATSASVFSRPDLRARLFADQGTVEK